MKDKEIMQALECCNAEYNECEKCPFKHKAYCERHIIENAFDLIKRQQVEIERLEKEVDRLSECVLYHDGQISDAIKEFADRFDDELAKLRDTYFERGLKDYSLVCEVIHDYLYRTLREMVGAIE